MKKALLFASLLSLAACGEADPSATLQKTLRNLEQIRTAAYFCRSESYVPGDTIPSVQRRFEREWANPADTAIGSGYLSFSAEDTTRLLYGYDGTIRIEVEHDTQEVLADDFTRNQLPFRIVRPPFFNRAENIVRYALTTSDPIETQLVEEGDSYRFRLVIDIGKTVEFIGKARYMPDHGNVWGKPLSVYELWIRKKDLVPYRIRREQVHQTTDEVVSEVAINRPADHQLQIEDFYPAGYTLRMRKDKRSDRPKEWHILGKTAPEWTLTAADGSSVSLGDFRSKVLLINFTGIGCGPCYQAIPFLNGLKARYAPGDFDIVAIETWGKSPYSIGVYAERNKMTYRMLAGTDEVRRAYLPDSAVPVFLLLDGRRKVRKVHTGYAKGSTDQAITEAIDKLLEEN